MVAGDKRRKVEDTEQLSISELVESIERVEEPRDQALIALLYLSGRRIREILRLQKQDFHLEENRISFDTFNEKVYRSKRSGDFTIQRGERFYQRIRPHWRTDTESGNALSKFVVATLGSLEDPEDYLFQKLRGKGPITDRSTAYKIIRRYLPNAWPHLLRHDRFTEVARIYKDDPVAMHRFTYHKRFESTLQYIRKLEEERI